MKNDSQVKIKQVEASSLCPNGGIQIMNGENTLTLCSAKSSASSPPSKPVEEVQATSKSVKPVSDWKPLKTFFPRFLTH